MNTNSKEIIKISVRNLVEFIFREGDIQLAEFSIRNTDVMQQGSRIHRKIQKKMGSNYSPEVPLCFDHILQCENSEFILRIEGRADGIIRDDLICIDEIKGVHFDLFSLTEPIFLHKAQAMCYAYMLSVEEELTNVGVQVTYCHLETEQERRFYEAFSFKEIEIWFLDLLEQYSKWAIYEYQWKIKRNHSIKTLEFPFAYREGQRDLVIGVYRTLEREKKLFLEAPTGVGKTISTLFPTIKAMGEGLTDRIFYLTAKTITRTVAEECFDTLSNCALFCKAITLTSKEKLCIFDKTNCNPFDCPRAKGHYNRVNDAVYKLLTTENRIDRHIILQYAQKYEVCPYEMSLDASLFADAIICDYNYVFDPTAYLRRFFASDKKTNSILLIDEAHNLVERAREMYSCTLYKDDFLSMKQMIKKMFEASNDKFEKTHLTNFIKALESGNRQMLAWKRNCDEFCEIEALGLFPFCVLKILGEYEIFLKEHSLLVEREPMLQFYFNLRLFSDIVERLDEKYVIYSDYDENNHFRIKLQCMDPSTNLENILTKVRSAVFFSATLLPIRYYKEQLAGKEDDYAVYSPSSFPPQNRKILIARDVSSKYTRRTESEFRKITDYLLLFATSREGNYMFFFPSYAYMEQIYNLFEPLISNAVLLMQNKSMSESEKETFLNNFSRNANQTHIGFCVMGGIFSEGIDLKSDRLIGVAIVGTGLPMICNERELFRRYYQEKTGKGFDYAYLYQGMNKVLQSGGRVIRTAEDRGVILLLDERFSMKQYHELFPKEWFPNELVTKQTLPSILSSFWNP